LHNAVLRAHISFACYLWPGDGYRYNLLASSNARLDRLFFSPAAVHSALSLAPLVTDTNMGIFFTGPARVLTGCALAASAMPFARRALRAYTRHAHRTLTALRSLPDAVPGSPAPPQLRAPFCCILLVLRVVPPSTCGFLFCAPHSTCAAVAHRFTAHCSSG